VYTPEGDFDFATQPLIVPCDQPHHNEVVAMPVMGDGPFPEGDLEPLVVSLCEPEYEAFLGKPSDQAVMRPLAYWPDANDWAAGARSAVCTVYTDDRVVGTARSGSLRAPGERIAVYREVRGDSDIWLVDAGTGELTNLTEDQQNEIIDIPSWRPDGTAIAFSMEEAAGDTGIHEVSADGGRSRPILVGSGATDGPRLSPDGTRMAYIAKVGGGEYDLFVQDLATGESTRLTNHPDRDSNADWSPDGELIAFRRRDGGQSDIWVMRADGTEPVQLTSDAGNNYGPMWSPDGTTILFSSDRTGNFDVWVMDADGSNQRPITDHPANDDFPAWSSDGAFIAFQSDRYLGDTLWLMRADGSDQSELAGSYAIGWPRFAPVRGD
jgi:TolB protein